MGYLIDTNLWIAVERGVLAPADIHSITGPAPLFVSPVNIAELRYGIELMPEGPMRNKAIASYRRILRKPLLRITAETAEVFGCLAAALHRSGRAADFRIQDVWLAAQCAQRDFTLLTSNARDFADIPTLRWREVPLARK